MDLDDNDDVDDGDGEVVNDDGKYVIRSHTLIRTKKPTKNKTKLKINVNSIVANLQSGQDLLSPFNKLIPKTSSTDVAIKFFKSN